MALAGDSYLSLSCSRAERSIACYRISGRSCRSHSNGARKVTVGTDTEVCAKAACRIVDSIWNHRGVILRVCRGPRQSNRLSGYDQ